MLLVELPGKIWAGWVNLAFPGRRAEKYRANGEKDEEAPNNSKRTEPAFIEPMQCKPVTALPRDEKWTFELKCGARTGKSWKKR